MMETTFTIAILIAVVLAYFLPTIVAMSRRHRQRDAIILLNAFAGWTLIGWVAALCWSVVRTN